MNNNIIQTSANIKINKIFISPPNNNLINMNKLLFSKSPQPFSCREIQSKYDFRPKIKNKAEYIHDLSCTLAINLKNISNIKSTDKITINQMDIIRNKVEIILKLFKNLRKQQKNIKKIKSQILVHNQLLEEIKRRKQENLLMLQEKKLELYKALEKKQIIYRKSRKKFNEVETYVRRECQSYTKYKNLYIDFTMDSFIAKNTSILNIVKNKKNKLQTNSNLINFINYENKDYKDFISNKNELEKNSKCKKISLNNLLLIQQDKIKYFENYLKQIENLYNNVDKMIIKVEETVNNDNNNNDIIANKIIKNLNDLHSDDNNSILFKNEFDSTNNYPENENPDSSELWSASEIEK